MMKRRAGRRWRLPVIWDRMATAGIERQEACAKRGDVVLWHASLPHEGTKVKDPSRTRKSYVTHYTSDWALPDWVRHHDLTGKPIGVFENGGVCNRPKWFSELPVLPSWDMTERAHFGWLPDLAGRVRRRLGRKG